jgi:hypothetical protein
MAWMVRLGADRQVGIEAAWNYGGGLAQYLVTGAETVYQVNPSLDLSDAPAVVHLGGGRLRQTLSVEHPRNWH